MGGGSHGEYSGGEGGRRTESGPPPEANHLRSGWGRVHLQDQYHRRKDILRDHHCGGQRSDFYIVI